MNNGYIKLHRKILDNPVVMKSTDHLAVWMYLLLHATHTNYDTLFEGGRMTLQSGQLITGRKVIAKTLKINESKIQRILKTFEIEQQIEQQTSSRCRIISILNWCDYQQSEQQIEQQVNNKRTLNKKVKKIKNKDSDHFDEFWFKYPRKIGKSICSNKYIIALKKTNHDKIMKSLDAHVKSWKDTDIEFIPHPSTWLNQERWDDVVATQEVKSKPKTFRKTKTGLYIAYCLKCGNKAYPNDFQIKSVSCCGTDWITEKPDLKNTSEIDKDIIGRVMA